MRKIRTRIEFEFDEEMLRSDDPEITMSDEDMLRYAASCFADDIDNMVKYNEVFEVALRNTEFVEISSDASAGN